MLTQFLRNNEIAIWGSWANVPFQTKRKIEEMERKEEIELKILNINT